MKKILPKSLNALSQYPQFIHQDADQSLEELLAFALDVRLIDDYHDQQGSIIVTVHGRRIQCTYSQVWSWLAGALNAYRKMML